MPIIYKNRQYEINLNDLYLEQEIINKNSKILRETHALVAMKLFMPFRDSIDFEKLTLIGACLELIRITQHGRKVEVFCKICKISTVN